MITWLYDFSKTKGEYIVMISWEFPSCAHAEESCSSCLEKAGEYKVRFLTPSLKNIRLYVMNRFYLIQSLLSDKEYAQALHHAFALHRFYEKGEVDSHAVPLDADVLSRVECMFEELFFRAPRLASTINHFDGVKQAYAHFCSIYESLRFEVYFHGLVHYAEQLSPSAEQDKNFSTWLRLHGKNRKWTAFENDILDYHLQYGVFPPTGFNEEEDLLTHAKLYVKNPSLDSSRKHVEHHFLKMTDKELMSLDEYTVLWLSIALTQSLPKSKALPLTKWRLWREKAIDLASLYDKRNGDNYLTSLIYQSNIGHSAEDVFSID